MDRLSRTAITLTMGLFFVSCSTSPTGTDPDPTPSNNAPVAQAGADQTVSANLPASVDGSASSDADGDPITYAWSFSATPGGSGAALDDATSATPTFTPDIAGDYVLQLIVSDGTDDSTPATVTVSAEDNTSSAMVGPAGGMLSSVDGMMTMEIPAGAMATDQEISITMAHVSQRPEELADLDDDAVVYEFKPDGLQFDLPVELTITVPESLEPTVDGDRVVAPVLLMATLSDGTVELAAEQQLTVDAEASSSELRASIDHFSWGVAGASLKVGTETVSIEATAFVPPSVPVNVDFVAGVEVRGFFGDDEDPTAMDGVSGILADASTSPIEVSGTFDDELDLESGGDDPHQFGENMYRCTDVPLGIWSNTVLLHGFEMDVSDGPAVTDQDPLSIKFTRPVVCEAGFTPFDLPSPEGVIEVNGRQVGPTPSPPEMVVAHTGGATMTNDLGETIAKYTAAELAGIAVYGAAALALDGLMVNTPLGLFLTTGILPTTPSAPPIMEDLVRVPQPMTGPDMTANASDIVTFGNGTNGFGVAAVLSGDSDIAFFSSGTDDGGAAGFNFRDDLATSFKPAGESVFGTDVPVSVHVGEDGWTETTPILVVTINSETLESKLWLAQLVAGVAVVTQVDNIFPAESARQIRCLATICAITSYGSGFGFGGITIFQWDGGDTFTPIQGLAGRTIGLDLRLSAVNTVLIAHTHFTGGSYLVHEVSTMGEYLGTVWEDLPEACTGAGFIRLRRDNEAVITCNTGGGGGGAVMSVIF